MSVRKLYGSLKIVTAVACGYEAFAITTKKVPTISMYCGRHRWLPPVIIAALALHLYWPFHSAQSVAGLSKDF